LGTSMLWFGWFGFNAGSASGANQNAVSAFVASHLAASFAGLTWMALDKIMTGKPTVTGLCVGFVAGLATITPPSGYVDALPAMAIGIISAIVGYFTIFIRKRGGFDDSLDVLAVHGFAAASGVLMTGIFADNRINGGTINGGGWINHVWIQLAWQLCGLTVGAAWSAVVTWIICEVLDRTMGLRATKEDELLGLDQAYHGESIYEIEAIVAKALAAAGVPAAKQGQQTENGAVEMTKTGQIVVNFHHTPDDLPISAS